MCILFTLVNVYCFIHWPYAIEYILVLRTSETNLLVNNEHGIFQHGYIKTKKHNEQKCNVMVRIEKHELVTK